MTILKEGLTLANELNVEEVRTKIVEKETFQGLQGKFKINPYGDALKSFYKYQIINGEFKLIEDVK